MRASPEIRPHLVAQRMKRWLDIVRCPIMSTKVPTWRARKNYRNLVRKYPEIAAACGFTESMSFPSPLLDLWSPVQQHEPQQALAPRQEFPASGIPRIISLEDEVL